MNPWTYKGFTVYPRDVNGSGVRWQAVIPTDRMAEHAGCSRLAADTKQGMRDLINHLLKGQDQ